MTKKPVFLLVNDDGIHAEGLFTLAKYMRELGEVHVVAPLREHSGSGHALSIRNPLRAEKIPLYLDGVKAMSLDGTPADCTLFALDKVMPRRPDFIISGINHGSNLGRDVLCSGTVAAAMEGAAHGIPSIAISVAGRGGDLFHFDTAGNVITHLLGGKHPLEIPPKRMLNINVPSLAFDAIRGIKGATLGRLLHDLSFKESEDPRGKPYYWLGCYSREFEDIPGSDCNLMDQGYVTMSLLEPSLLDRIQFEKFNKDFESKFGQF